MTEHAEIRKSGIRAIAERVFTVLTGISLVGSLAVLLTWSPDWVTPMWLTYLRLAVTLLGLLLWDRKDAGFGILAAYLGLVVLRMLIPSPEKLFDTKVSQTLFVGAWAFAGCYSLGHILDRRRIERFLKTVLSGLVFCMACCSLVAVYAAWTDQKIWNIGQGSFWGLDIVSGGSSARLRMLFEPNTSGTLLGLAVMAAFLCAAGGGSRWLRGFHLLMMIPCWVALSLTDSRAAQAAAAVGIGAAAGILIFGSVRKRIPGRKLPAWLAATAGIMLITVVCIVISVGTTGLFNRLKAGRGNLVSGAAAESAADTGLSEVSVVPSEIKAGLGEGISFTAETGRSGEDLRYQWQFSNDGEEWKDNSEPSAADRTLLMQVREVCYRRYYRCVVTAGDETFCSGKVKILPPYTVLVASEGSSKADGDIVKLTVKTDGTEGTVSYQWQVSDDVGKTWNDIQDGQGTGLTVRVQGERRYRCIVTAENGVMASGIKRISEPSGTSIKSRGISRDDPLNGRTKIWKQVLRYLAGHRRTLLIGRTVSDPMKDTGIVRNSDIPAEHCHNMFLQTVMESGVPGLLLVLAFILCTAVRGVRVAASEELPLLLRLVPAAVCAVWAGELVECIVRMSGYQLPNLAVLMLYAGIVCALGKKK